MSYRDLFPDHDLMPEERAAHDEEPRPGSCFAPDGGDSAMVSQSDTDILIRVELWSHTSGPARAQLEALMGVPRWRPGAITDPMVPTTYQRGGIDSDPLVRLLAYRAWGNRDRRWFEERGVRSGDNVAAVGEGLRGAIKIALAWNRERVFGRALADARPGEEVEVAKIGRADRRRSSAHYPERFLVADRVRVEGQAR